MLNNKILLCLTETNKFIIVFQFYFLPVDHFYDLVVSISVSRWKNHLFAPMWVWLFHC